MEYTITVNAPITIHMGICYRNPNHPDWPYYAVEDMENHTIRLYQAKEQKQIHIDTFRGEHKIKYLVEKMIALNIKLY